MPTVGRILQLAPVAQYLASNRVSKGTIFGNQILDPLLPNKIFMVYKILKRVYDIDQTFQSTQQRVVADYLYELIQKFAFKAAAIVDNNTGGQIVVPTGSTTPNALDFEVSASSFIVTGASSVTIPQYRGYNIVNFSRNGIWQNTTSLGDGSSYYAWNSVTGLFSIFPAASADELFRITPDTTGGISYVTNANIPDTIILAADGTYTLASGYQIWKITINPSVADTVRIGTTANGEEIMMDKVMTINTYANNGVTADVFAEGGDQTIYFTGFTGAATINIYTLPI